MRQLTKHMNYTLKQKKHWRWEISKNILYSTCSKSIRFTITCQWGGEGVVHLRNWCHFSAWAAGCKNALLKGPFDPSFLSILVSWKLSRLLVARCVFKRWYTTNDGWMNAYMDWMDWMEAKVSHGNESATLFNPNVNNNNNIVSQKSRRWSPTCSNSCQCFHSLHPKYHVARSLCLCFLFAQCCLFL